MAGYDGEIKIDTAIDQKGFNSGVARIVKGFQGVIRKIGTELAVFGGKAALAVGVLGSVGGAVVGAVAGGLKIVNQLVTTLANSMSATSAYRDQVLGLRGAFDGLKGALAAAAATLLGALAPALNVIIQWLVKAINFAVMFIAALTRQKTVAQYASGSLDKAAGGAGKLAKNTKQAAKAAEGALAAFDEINVLQKDRANEDFDAGGGGGGGGGIPISFEEVPVPENFLASTWESIKAGVSGVLSQAWETLKMLWEIIKIYVSLGWDWIVARFGDLVSWIDTAIATPVREFIAGLVASVQAGASAAWEWIQSAFSGMGDWVEVNLAGPFREFVYGIAEWVVEAWEWIKGVWQGAGPWFQKTIIDPIVGWFSTAWEDIKTWAADAWEWIVEKWQGAGAWFSGIVDEIAAWFESAWEDIKTWVGNAWDWVVSIWQGAADWFTTQVTDPIESAFTTALEWLEGAWEGMWEGVKEFAKGAINGVIDLINGLLQAVATGLNTIITAINKLKIKVPDSAVFGELAGLEIGFNIPPISAPQIPRLAKGAVIPPNAEFLALLGDQRSGRNIETPEGLLRQIVQEEVGRVQAEIRIEFGGSLGALVRELKPYIDRETVRVGRSLVSGGMA